MISKKNEADLQAQSYLDMERSLAGRTRKTQIVLLALCGALLLALGLALCLLPQQQFSPEENRTLTTAPSFSFNTLFDGSLTRQLADFCADQFPLRSAFVRLKAGTELLLGKQENNGILLGSDGYLITKQEYTTDDRLVLEQNVRAVRRFEQVMEHARIPFTFAVVPRSLDVNTQKLPSLYDPTNTDAVWSWLQDACTQENTTADILTAPLHQSAENGEAVWYRTDHHWTAQGAYHAYVALGDLLGYEPYAAQDFEPTVVCEDFLGTTYASSGMRWIPAENITLWRFDGDEALQTDIIEGGESRTIQGLYDFTALETHDKYRVFLGGTNAVIRVSDPTRQQLPTLLLLKDSFSQSLAPFLARHYQLLLIDPRTFMVPSGQSFYDCVLDQHPDQILLLYGIDTLCESTSLKILTLGLSTSSTP